MELSYLLTELCPPMLLAIVAMVISTTDDPSQDPDEAAKKADAELRRTKGSLLSGKYQEVFDKLGTIDGMIAGIQAANPAHPSLQKLIPAFTEQKDKVEQKLGKSLTVKASLTVQTSATPQAPQKQSSGQPGQAQALPYDARRPMEQFNSQFSSFQTARKEITTATGDNYRMAVERMGRRVDEMAASLEDARAAAANKGVSTHPALDEAAANLASALDVNTQIQGAYKAGAAAAASAEKAVAGDSEALKALHQEMRTRIFDRATGNIPYYSTPEDVEELLVAIESFERTEKTSLERTLAGFEAKYGKTQQEVEKSTGDWQASHSYEELKKGIINVGKTREVMAEDLVKKYEDGFTRLADIHDFYKVKQAIENKKYIDMATRFSPENEKAKNAHAGYQQRVDAALRDFHAAVDKRKWSGNSGNAPSNAPELAQAALKFFREDIEWGRRDKHPSAKDKEIWNALAVSITGPWSVQGKNVLGQPIMFGVPALVAIEVANEKELNLVRVFDVTMRTEEKEGVKQSPPFVSVTVGNSYYIRRSALT